MNQEQLKMAFEGIFSRMSQENHQKGAKMGQIGQKEEKKHDFDVKSALGEHLESWSEEDLATLEEVISRMGRDNQNMSPPPMGGQGKKEGKDKPETEEEPTEAEKAAKKAEREEREEFKRNFGQLIRMKQRTNFMHFFEKDIDAALRDYQCPAS